MKTENFDDAVRRKIESINHRFTEKDIENVHNFVKANRAPWWLKGPFQKLIVYSISGLVITGLITWQLTKMHDREILNQTVETLKKDYGKNITPTPDAGNAQKQGTAQPQNAGTADGGQQNDLGSQTAIRENKKAEQPGNGANRSSFSQEKTSATQPGLSRRTARYISHKTNSARSRQLAANVSGMKQNDGTVTGSILNPGNTNDQNATQNGNKPSIYESQPGSVNNQNNLPVINEQDAAKNAQPNGSAPNNTTTKAPDPLTAAIELKKIEETKKADSLRIISNYRGPKYDQSTAKPINVRFLGGIEAIASNYEFNHSYDFGGGVNTELVLDNKWSLSVGFTRKITNDDFSNGTVFSDQCGKDLDNVIHTDYYPNPNQQPKTNISISDTLFQIPLMLTYYFPLKNHFALSLSIGTNLDVYSHQSVNYLQKPSYVSPWPEQCDYNNPAAVLFNNFNASIGVLKQYGPFVVQLNPYATWQLTNVDYELHNFYFGATLKLMYSVGKGGF